MAAQLAKSIFTRTPSEETAVEDVYKSTGDATVNSFQDITGTSTELVDSISFLSKSNASKILSGPTKENAQSLSDTINSSMGDASGKTKSMIGDLMGKAKSGFGSLKDATKTISGTIRTGADAYVQIGGLVTAVKSGNLKDLRNVTNTLNTITGKTTALLSANGAMGKIYGTVVDQASAAGISDSFKVVADSVKENTALVNKSSVLYTMASTSLPGAVSRGDYRNVASMVDSLGTGAVSMMNPSAVSQLAKNSTTKVTPSSIGGAAGQFVQYQDAYKKIDPKWNTSQWKSEGGKIYKDLSKLIGASKETKQVFTIGSKMDPTPDTNWYSALDAIKTQPTVDSVVKKQFPYSISTTPPMTTLDTDPRVEPSWWKDVVIS